MARDLTRRACVRQCSICQDSIKHMRRAFSAMRETQSASAGVPQAMPEAPDRQELGRATWTLLHTMAAYYPDEPSVNDKLSAALFLHSLSHVYPCHVCRDDLQAQLEAHPPQLESRQAFSQWMCAMHNRINVQLRKPEFDCNLVAQRWHRAARASDPHWREVAAETDGATAQTADSAVKPASASTSASAATN